MSSKLNFCPPKRSPLRTYAGSFMGPDHPLQEVESGEQIGGGFGCRGCTGASASYIDHVMWFTEGTTHYPRIKKKKGTGRSSWKRKKKLWSASFQKHEQRRADKIVQRTALTGRWFTKTCTGI